jgi:hypothetical protein
LDHAVDFDAMVGGDRHVARTAQAGIVDQIINAAEVLFSMVSARTTIPRLPCARVNHPREDRM